MALSKYRPDIDGLRAVAVMAVVLNHLSAPLVPGGYVGVDVFFVISGYLITRIISREMQEGSFTFARFYERRARRIFPALFAMLAVTLAVGYFLLFPSDYANTLRATLGTLLFSSNVIFWREMAEGYFAATDSRLNPLLHTWSLAVEEQFYVVFPILLIVCYRSFYKHIFWIFLGCFLLSLGGAALLIKSKSVAVFFLSPFRAWELLAGAMLALGHIPEVRSRALREALATGGLIAILIACFAYDEKTTFPGLAALLPVLGTAAVIHAGGNGSTLAGRMLQWRPVVYVGLISYSLYLWHWPLIVLAQFFNEMDSLTSYLPVLFAGSLLLGSLSYHFIEQPFRHGRWMVRQATVFSCTAISVSLLGVFAFAGLVKDGFSTRFDPIVVSLDKARSPHIPYKQCNGKNLDPSCSLGRKDIAANTLLWGDSHMLALAPAFQDVFFEKKQHAILSVSFGCPPLFGVENSINNACSKHNNLIKKYLLSRPEMDTIIMAAYWGMYFRETGPLSEVQGNSLVKGTGAAHHALVSTVEWLHKHNRRVILIGPVPVYDKSVPLTLALKHISDQVLIFPSAHEQRLKHADFFAAIKDVPLGMPFQFLDPIEWLCKNECKVMQDSVSFYRDSHHLSVAGAMALKVDLVNHSKIFDSSFRKSHSVEILINH